MRILLLVALGASLAACASGVQKLRKIDPGMTEAQVEQVMGRRDGFATAQHQGAAMTLHKWTNRLCNGHVNMYEKCDFYVVYRDGRVIETGTAAVRGAPPSMQFFYLFNP